MMSSSATLRRRGAKWFHLEMRGSRGAISSECESRCYLLQQEKRFNGKRFFTSERPDPFARRPNQICDPYGQGGKPLSLEDSKQLLLMLDEGWELDCDGEDTPKALFREYHHRDYIRASVFISKIAAVGDLNNHYPTISLERKLLSREKRWEITTTIRCHTVTLAGLSRNDFHVAMLIDVEAARPEISQLLFEYET
jgi:pterin-4a-carbinolamine dehydratase